MEIDLPEKLKKFGSVSVTNGVITVVTKTVRDDDELQSWRKTVHEFVRETTEGMWQSERGSKAWTKGTSCRFCQEEIRYQFGQCDHCCMECCDCLRGFRSQPGYKECLRRYSDRQCKPRFYRVYNAVFVYISDSKTIPKMSRKERRRNQRNQLFRSAQPLLLANTFYGPNRPGNPECPFGTRRLQWDIVYKILLVSFGGKHKRRSLKRFIRRQRPQLTENSQLSSN